MNDPRSEKLNAVVEAVRTVNETRRIHERVLTKLVNAQVAVEKLSQAGHPAGDAQAETNRLRLVEEEARRAFEDAELELEFQERRRLGEVAA